MTTMTQFPFEQILEACKLNDEKILHALDLPIQKNGKIQCECPIHQGDNPNAFSYCPKRKCWQCFTHKCHLKYGSNLIGLIKAIKKCGYVQAVDFIVELLNIQDIITDSELEVKRYLRGQTDKIEKVKIYPESILDDLPDGTDYFLERGVSPNILKLHRPFICLNNNKPLYGRACLTVRNKKGEIVGFSGRKTNLLDSPEYLKVPKWYHSPKTVSTNSLFGIDIASKNCKNNTIILVEGCIGVLKLQQAGILNVVATFGTKISNAQRKELVDLNIKRVVTLFDPDEAGKHGREIVNKKCQLYFEVINLEDKITKDPGHMDNGELLVLKTLLETYA